MYVVSVVILLAATTLPAAAAADQVTLTVSVVDGDGAPVAGAQVTAEWADGRATDTTRSNGQVLVDVPAGADVTITVDDDRYVRNRPYVLTDASGGEVTVPVAERGRAAVHVRDDDGPVASARVTVARDGDVIATGWTNDDGAFATGDIEQGVYEVQVEKPGYYDRERTIAVDGERLWLLDLEAGTVPVAVRVVDAHFDPPRPIPGARVTVGERESVETNGDGAFTFPLPVNTAFDLRVEKAGYEPAARTLSVGESATAATVATRRVPALSLSAANSKVVVGQTLRVTVTDEYGDPVADAGIRIDGERVAETGDDGTARVGIEAAGERRLVAVAAGVTSDTVLVEGVRAGGDEPTATTPASEATTNDTAPATTADVGPGFTPLAALAAVALALGLAARRRSGL